MSFWFNSISSGEPCDTYLKLSAGDLARTCEVIELHRSTFDGDDTLYVQNLQSIADYIQSAIVSFMCPFDVLCIHYINMCPFNLICVHLYHTCL